MYLFFLGYLLYLCMTITLTVDSAYMPQTPLDMPELNNCTQCDTTPCFSYTCKREENEPGCTICCKSKDNIEHDCCFCNNCPFCWHARWQVITMTHMSISILFVLGITGLSLVYCKLCNRTRQTARSRCFRTQQERNDTYCNTVEDLRERPPSYGDACGAPPLYTSPYNRVSMQDIPPTYPDTPKHQETCRCIPLSPPVVQHI